MTKERLFVDFDDRRYTLEVIYKEKDSLTIRMYGTNYILIRQEEVWINSPKNKNNLSPGLLKALAEKYAT